MGRRIVEWTKFHGRCIAGNPYSISEVQSSERRAGSIVHEHESTNVGSKLLSILSDFSRGRNKLGGVEIVIFFLFFRKHNGELRTKKRGGG